MTTWQISWNKKIYDYKRLIKDFKDGLTLEVTNSKGMAKMKVLPQINDMVYVSCDKKKIMICKVVTDFTVKENGSYDEYCISSNRQHAQNNTFLTLKIIEVYETPEKMLGFQRTWVKLR